MADRSSSSISSFETSSIAPHIEPGLTKRRVISSCAIAVVALVVVDIGLGWLFRMPVSPQTMPTALQQYFDYGRSVEGKLRRMVGATDAETALIAKAGWLDEQASSFADSPPGKIRVAVYGQSFAFDMVDAMQLLDDRFQVIARRGGPSAPLSHSYAAYRADAGEHGPDIVIIGVLASALPKVLSLTNTTTWFEAPTPYTYPRYRLDNGKLAAIAPRVGSLPDLRLALSDAAAWDQFVSQLRDEDLAFDPLLFEADWLDRSTLGRLARRAYGQRHLQQLDYRHHLPSGFTNADGLLDVSRAIAGDIGRLAAERGQLVCLLLIQDRGYQDHLATALGPFLWANNIPYFSTHLLAAASDTRNFVADGHFTAELNEKLARALLNDMRAQWLSVSRRMP